MRKTLMLAVVGLLIGATLGTFGPAYAGYQKSINKYFVNNGKGYYNNSDILTNSGDPNSVTRILSDDGTTIPINWVGAQARMYYGPSGGEYLCSSSVWHYNDTSGLTGVGIGITKYCGGGYYYTGFGRTRSLKTDGTYATHDTYGTLAEWQNIK